MLRINKKRIHHLKNMESDRHDLTTEACKAVKHKFFEFRINKDIHF